MPFAPELIHGYGLARTNTQPQGGQVNEPGSTLSGGVTVPRQKYTGPSGAMLLFLLVLLFFFHMIGLRFAFAVGGSMR